MPHIVVKLWPGETEESKHRLADEITKAVKRTLGYGPDSVSVAFDEIASGEWTEKVYNTEIFPNLDKLYKKPGMRPSVRTTMERDTRILRFCAGCLILCTPILPLAAAAQQAPPFLTLRYDGHMQGPVPIPASERSLETITAERWFTVSDQPMVLEGPAFDRTGALIFSDVYGGRILRLTSDRHLSTIATHKGLGNGGLAIHKDGRIFAACVGDLRGNGSIVAMNADGSHFQTIIPPSAGFLPNDLVFDMQGGFYFSDFHGTSVDPAGGVYYVAPDLRTVTPILRHVSEANGIALSPDGKRLWSTDFGRNMLLRIDLESPTSIALIGTAVPYYFTGAAPDSMRTDADGNVYVAMYSQGRVLVLNRNGIPIAQILLPGRDEGHNLESTSMALKPGTNELYIVTNDGSPGQGATIFRAGALAKAAPMYSQQ